MSLALKQRQYLGDKPLIQIPHPRPAYLDCPQTHRKPPSLAVAIAIAGLFPWISFALALVPSQPFADFLLQQILQVLVAVQT